MIRLISTELNYYGDPASDSGLTIVAKIYDSDGAQVGSEIACLEVGSLAIYKCTMSSVDAGVYAVRFFNGSNLKDQVFIEWNGTSERTVADTVWDEPYADHTTAGTFGKLINILKKSNTNFDGTVTANATASRFDTDLADPTGTHDHQLLLFTSGALAGQSKPILTFTNGAANTCTFEEPFTEAPQVGDEFIVIVCHVHPISQIKAGLATIANQAIINAGVKNASLLIPHTTDLP